MSNNLAIVLYVVVFMTSFLVPRLGVEQIYAQLPPYSPSIDNQNNLPLNNNNQIQPSNMGSNCMTISSSEGKYVSCSPNADNLPLTKGPVQSSNPIQSSNPVQTKNVKPSISSQNQYQITKNVSVTKGPIQTSNFNVKSPCPDLNVTDGIIPFKVPDAKIVQYQNVIKAVSNPPSGSLTVPINVGNFTFNISVEAQKICGTNHDDYIIGSEGGDIIFGLRGNDIITALGGDDLAFGGPGDDIMYGNDGNNQLFGESGNDNLVGGTGDDLLVGGVGNDRLYGNTGDDILQGGPGADYFDCGDGVDTVVDYNPSEGDIVSVNCENVNSVHSNDSGNSVHNHSNDSGNSVHSNDSGNSVHSNDSGNSVHSADHSSDNVNSDHSSENSFKGKQSVQSKPPPITAAH